MCILLGPNPKMGCIALQRFLFNELRHVMAIDTMGYPGGYVFARLTSSDAVQALLGRQLFFNDTRITFKSFKANTRFGRYGQFVYHRDQDTGQTSDSGSDPVVFHRDHGKRNQENGSGHKGLFHSHLLHRGGRRQEHEEESFSTRLLRNQRPAHIQGKRTWEQTDELYNTNVLGKRQKCMPDQCGQGHYKGQQQTVSNWDEAVMMEEDILKKQVALLRLENKLLKGRISLLEAYLDSAMGTTCSRDI